jgi:tripartite-type tricarboxylate transporter receptor subunit TctC
MQAPDYPTKPITVVVPFPAGGPSDVVARIVAEAMSKTLGQSMIIENVGGAGGTLGSGRVAAAQPDGYTLLAGSMGSHVSAPVLTPNLKYDSARDFAPIGFTAHSPAVIVAKKDFPAKDLKEFIAYLKQNGDKVKQAHGGIGSSSHMACLLFNTAAGTKPTAVAYRGTGPAMNDLIGGHVDFFCEQAVSVASHVKGGSIKAYGVSAKERLAALPAVPTAKEQGLDYQMSIWAGIFAPKGTPKGVIDKLAAALDKALDDPGVQKRLADLGGSIPAKDERTPEKFEAFVKAAPRRSERRHSTGACPRHRRRRRHRGGAGAGRAAQAGRDHARRGAGARPPQAGRAQVPRDLRPRLDRARRDAAHLRGGGRHPHVQLPQRSRHGACGDRAALAVR